MNNWLSRKAVYRLTLGNILVWIALVLTACGSLVPSPNEIRIGLIAPLTGELPSVGQSTIRAAELAVNQVNEAGGLAVGGQKYDVVLLIEDSANVPDTAVAAARKLINQDRVATIIGPQISRNAIPVAVVAENARIPMITPYSTNPATTADKEYVFRTAYVDSFQGEAMAQFALEQLNVETAAVLYDIANDYNRDIAEFFYRSFTAGGGEIVAFETYTTGETDFSQQLAIIHNREPQVLFLPNYPNEIPLQVRQARAAGITAILLGSDTWELDLLKTMPELDRAFVSAHYAADAANAAGQRFVDLYQQQYNEVPDSVAALTYDTFSLLFQAISNQGKVDPESIQDGLQEIKQFQGVTGLASYHGTGDPQKSVVILKVEKGVVTYYQTIDP